MVAIPDTAHFHTRFVRKLCLTASSSILGNDTPVRSLVHFCIKEYFMSGNGEQMVSEIVANLEEAWNAGGGAGFAQPFAKDADFVNIRAVHLRSREIIARGHLGIFDTIYKGS